MNIARIYTAIFVVVQVACFSATADSAAAAENRFLEIIHLDVGQEDATLVIGPGGNVLLVNGGDRGKGNRVVAPLLQACGIEHLDYVVATHYDADHIGGLDEVINHYRGRVGETLDRGRAGCKQTPSSKAYAQYVASARLKPDRDPAALGPGNIDLSDGVRVSVVAAGGCVLGHGSRPVNNKLDENSVSVALSLAMVNLTILLAAT